jgi:hypothetical protein
MSEEKAKCRHYACRKDIISSEQAAFQSRPISVGVPWVKAELIQAISNHIQGAIREDARYIS